MSVFKCKMCGGDLSIIEGQTVCECEYCCSRQTVPTLDNEKKITLFARANRLRSTRIFCQRRLCPRPVRLCGASRRRIGCRQKKENIFS